MIRPEWSVVHPTWPSSLPIRRRVLALSLAACSAAVLAACHGGSGSGTSSPTTRATTVTTSDVAAPTTRLTTPPTTVWKATVPQASPDDAAAQLVQAWAAGNRVLANQVAAPAAVAALFAAPYPGSYAAIPRGCSSGFPPIVCTYGPPGGGPSTSALFELSTTQTAQGWYVSSVRVET
jgi:hypothetical protein